jgi:anti-sigma factor RsiW
MSEHSTHPAAGGPALTCRDVIALLLDYLEATLDDDTVAQFERHLADCAPCRAYLRTYDRSRKLASEVNRVEMPAELRDRLRELLLSRLGSRPS